MRVPEDNPVLLRESQGGEVPDGVGLGPADTRFTRVGAARFRGPAGRGAGVNGPTGRTARRSRTSTP